MARWVGWGLTLGRDYQSGTVSAREPDVKAALALHAFPGQTQHAVPFL